MQRLGLGPAHVARPRKRAPTEVLCFPAITRTCSAIPNGDRENAFVVQQLHDGRQWCFSGDLDNGGRNGQRRDRNVSEQVIEQAYWSFPYWRQGLRLCTLQHTVDTNQSGNREPGLGLVPLSDITHGPLRRCRFGHFREELPASPVLVTR